MTQVNRQRVLVISKNSDVRNEIVTLLSGYGYFVEFCQSRGEGIRKFRAHKQPILILDVGILRIFPKRFFDFIQRVRKNTIVLIAAHKKDEADAFEKIRMGAYDILNLPLRTDFLKLTLKRALAQHALTLENIFVKNILFFGMIFLPLWLFLAYLILA